MYDAISSVFEKTPGVNETTEVKNALPPSSKTKSIDETRLKKFLNLQGDRNVAFLFDKNIHF